MLPILLVVLLVIRVEKVPDVKSFMAPVVGKEVLVVSVDDVTLAEDDMDVAVVVKTGKVLAVLVNDAVLSSGEGDNQILVFFPDAAASAIPL